MSSSTTPAKAVLPVAYAAEGSPVVSVSYSDLTREDVDLSASISAAFGPEGLGLLVVSSIPSYPALRSALLPLAASIAHLPPALQSTMESPESFYNFGWSLGKEQFNRRPDTVKGSFYANPLFDDPFLDHPQHTDLQRKWPSFALPNIWPRQQLPQLEGAFKSLGRLIVDVGIELSRHIDAFIATQSPSYPAGHLERVLRTSKNPKARLLHYYPLPASPSPSSAAPDAADGAEDVGIDTHCGYHNDHGSLTGLTSAQYMDDQTGEVLTASPDPTAGLYVCDRQGHSVQVKIPAESLAFQLGETQMIHSGGVVQATPHCVKASPLPHVSRQTFAVFMEPSPVDSMALPPGVSVAELLSAKALAILPKAVPRMSERYHPDDSFGVFSNKTFSAYYPPTPETDAVSLQ